MTEIKSIELLKTLVSFDTISHNSNLELIEFVENYLKKFGVKSNLIYDSTGKKANLYATIGPKEEKGIILSGHTDVVPVNSKGWDSDPFKLNHIDDKFFGRGSADMKGFLALALSRVPYMIEAKISKPIHLAFSYDEEIGCVGVHSLIDFIKSNSITPDYCIVGEPTNMEAVIGHKGKSGYKVEVRGLPFHSGQAPFGVNAINYAAKIMLYISNLDKEKSISGPFDHDYEIPYSTLHTGIVSGGTAPNIVPDLCEFEFEIRNIADENPEELLNKIKSYTLKNILPEMQEVSEKTGIYFQKKVSYPGLLIETNSAFVNNIKRILNKESHKKVIFGSEAGLFMDMLNIPTIVCGPGSINQAHKANEYITLSQIVKGGNFLDKLITSIGTS